MYKQKRRIVHASDAPTVSIPIIFPSFSKKLDETTSELKVTSRLLAEEKQKTENLLCQMLPQKVANELKNGRSVKAGKYVFP